MKNVAYGLVWIVFAMLGPMAGCGSSGGVDVYPVKGKVSFEGSPMMGGGAIAFIPKGDQAGAAAGGEIKDDGTYELTTYEPGDGSMTGEFKVTIIQSVYKEPTATPDGSKAVVAAADVPPAQRIPAIYNSSNDTPLTATVESKPNEIDFQLKRQ